MPFTELIMTIMQHDDCEWLDPNDLEEPQTVQGSFLSTLSAEDRIFLSRVFDTVQHVDFRVRMVVELEGNTPADRRIARLRENMHQLERDLARIRSIWAVYEQQYVQADALLLRSQEAYEQLSQRIVTLEENHAQQIKMYQQQVIHLEQNKHSLQTALQSLQHRFDDQSMLLQQTRDTLLQTQETLSHTQLESQKAMEALKHTQAVQNDQMITLEAQNKMLLHQQQVHVQQLNQTIETLARKEEILSRVQFDYDQLQTSTEHHQALYQDEKERLMRKIEQLQHEQEQKIVEINQMQRNYSMLQHETSMKIASLSNEVQAEKAMQRKLEARLLEREQAMRKMMDELAQKSV